MNITKFSSYDKKWIHSNASILLFMEIMHYTISSFLI